VLNVRWADHERDRMQREARASGKKDEEPATRLQREPVTSSILARTPDRADRLADPSDPKQDLGLRARSYLHANCAQCHVIYGGGNALLELEFKTPLPDTRTLDVKPLHHGFGMADPRVIAPGSPERSVLLHRMSLRGPGQMPPLATSVADEEGLKLMRAWITHLGTKAPGDR
jgi:mono/diheme cytochrome c family protein